VNKNRDAIQIKVKLDYAQSALVNNLIGSMRFARNKLIDITDEYYQKYNHFISKGKKATLVYHLPYLKSKFDFLKDVPSLSLQNMALKLEDDYLDYISYLSNPKGRKIGKPSKKYKEGSLTIPINTGSDIKYDYKNNKLTFTKFKIGKSQSWIDVKLHRLPFGCKPNEVQSFIREITISKIKYSKNEYLISFSFGRKLEILSPKLELPKIDLNNIDQFKKEAFEILSKNAIGIDVGIKSFVVTSNNNSYKKPLDWNRFDHKLARAQRALARKTKRIPRKSKQKLDFSSIQKSEEELEILKSKKDKQKDLKKSGLDKRSKSKSERFKNKDGSKKPKSPKGSSQRQDILDIIDKSHQEYLDFQILNNPRQQNKTYKNIEKNKCLISKLHKKVSNQNKDFVNKVVYDLVAKRQEKIICIENLNIQGMMKNRKLAKAIGRSLWGFFFQKLKSKCKEFEKIILECGMFDPSSKQCNCCNHINNDLKLEDRMWICKKCFALLDRDHNAALNILKFAIEKYIDKLIEDELKSSLTIIDQQKIGKVKPESAASQQKPVSYDLELSDSEQESISKGMLIKVEDLEAQGL
jgi:putative transposase